MKTCTKCQESLPLSSFWRHKNAKDGLHPRCKACASAAHKEWIKRNPWSVRNRQRKYLYGINNEDYERMVGEQGGKCAICRCSEPGGKGEWHIDHSHETGAVRGLLCKKCNMGIGHFEDDLDRLKAAIEYLS